MRRTVLALLLILVLPPILVACGDDKPGDLLPDAQVTTVPGGDCARVNLDKFQDAWYTLRDGQNGCVEGIARDLQSDDSHNLVIVFADYSSQSYRYFIRALVPEKEKQNFDVAGILQLFGKKIRVRGKVELKNVAGLQYKDILLEQPAQLEDLSK